MSRQARLHSLLQHAFSPDFLDVLNESHNHGGPATESHYKVTLVSTAFAGLRAVARHQRVYALTQDEMAQGMHALALHLYTPEEWAATGAALASPACLGGSKHG
ncbi:MAG: BolA family protein [Pseudomonadota bacterium]